MNQEEKSVVKTLEQELARVLMQVIKARNCKAKQENVNRLTP